MFCLMIISNFMWHGFTVIVRAFAIALMLTIYPDHTSYVLLGKPFVGRDLRSLNSKKKTFSSHNGHVFLHQMLLEDDLLP